MKNYSKKSQKVGHIMGINVISSSRSEVLTAVKDFISDSVKFYIVTPNPELILMAQKNEKLKKALNSADLSIPDGIGLSQASKYYSIQLPKNLVLRILVGLFQGLRVGMATFFDRNWLTKEIKPTKGRELFMDLIKLAAEEDWKVFLLGGLGNEAQLAKLKIENSMKNEKCKLKINLDPGPKLDISAKPLTNKDREIEIRAIEKINKFAPQILFVAHGAPKQEIWVNEHLKDLNIGGAMCVGGTFRYIAGLSKLPPEWMARSGLEWLWRVFTEPVRLGRIFRAVVIFPIKLFLSRL